MTPVPTEREFAIDVVRRLRDAGHEALWAGGCVRDELLGLVPKDYDVATAAWPEQVQKIFRRTIEVGAAFGVVEVLGPRTDDGFLKVQVATFRRDVSYTGGRRPDAVEYSDAREDALRRDFTINGMFFDPLEGKLIDYVGGQEDLRARLLRAIGDPKKRFTEDKLRLLRAVRLATRFDLIIDPATESALKAMAGAIGIVAAERVAEELRKVLVDPRRAEGMRRFVDLGLARVLLPELLPMRGMPYGPPVGENRPTGDLWDHVLRVLDLLGSKSTFPLALAALLHDAGKPRTVGRAPDRYTFHNHEHIGRDMADEICLRLKLSNDERERAVWLVEKHQYLSDAPHMRLSKLKVTLNHPGAPELLALHRADALAAGRSTAHVEFCEDLLRQWTPIDLDPGPILTGEDLIRAGLTPGPLFKRLLDAVREAQLDGTIHSKEEAWELIKPMGSGN